MNDQYFRIVTTVSADFESALKMFIPSWAANSGTTDVKVYRAKAKKRPGRMVERDENIRDEVLKAARTGGKILALDADCFVVRPLHDGFSPEHPLSVARWPNINAGVIFFNTAVAFEWQPFFDELLELVRGMMRVQERRGVIRIRGGQEQDAWKRMLHKHETAVHKLKVNEWNYCHQRGGFAKQFAKYRRSMRIIHVKGRGRWYRPEIRCKMDLVRQAFGARVQGCSF